MNNIIEKTNIYKEYNNALNNKDHLLYWIVKKINKKTINSYYKEYFQNFNWRYSFERYEMIHFIDKQLYSFYKDYYQSPEKWDSIDQCIYRFYVWNYKIWILRNNDNNYFLLKWINKDKRLIYPFEISEHQHVAQINSWNAYDNSAPLIKQELENILYSENWIMSLFSWLYWFAMQKSLWYSWSYPSELEWNNIYSLLNFYKYRNLNPDIFNDFYWINLIELSNFISSNNFDKVDYYKYQKKDDTWYDDALFNNFYQHISKLLIHIYWENINLDNLILENFKLLEFYRYYEIYDTYNNTNIIQSYLDYIKYYLNENINNPQYIINNHLHKFSSLSLSDLTISFYNKFLEDWKYEINKDQFVLNNIWYWDKKELYYRYYNINYYNKSDLYEFKEIFSEIFEWYVEFLISDNYKLNNFKELKTLICNIQYEEIYKEWIVWNYIDNDSLIDLLYNKQWSILKLKNIDIYQNKWIFTLDDNKYFEISFNSINIENSYTTWISSKNNNWFISMSWSMKLSKIEINKNGELLLKLSNDKFRINTQNIKLSIY